MFGMPAVPFFNAGDNGSQGAQVRGFGFLHDGSVDTVFRFLHATVFNFAERYAAPAGRAVRPRLRQRPGADRRPAGHAHQRQQRASPPCPARLDLFDQRMAAGRVRRDRQGRGRRRPARLVRLPSGQLPQRSRQRAAVDRGAARALAASPGQDLTYTAVPPGSGERMGVDRDEDGYFDRDEIDRRQRSGRPALHPGWTDAHADADLAADEHAGGDADEHPGPGLAWSAPRSC